MTRTPRGYTVTELVVAGTLTAVAMAGGLLAVRSTGEAQARAELMRVAADAIKRMDALRSQPDGQHCALARTLGGHPRVKDCATALAETQHGESLEEGALPSGIRWAVRWTRAEGTLLRADVTFHDNIDGTRVEHALLVRP